MDGWGGVGCGVCRIVEAEKKKEKKKKEEEGKKEKKKEHTEKAKEIRSSSGSEGGGKRGGKSGGKSTAKAKAKEKMVRAAIGDQKKSGRLNKLLGTEEQRRVFLRITEELWRWAADEGEVTSREEAKVAVEETVEVVEAFASEDGRGGKEEEEEEEEE